MFYYFIMGCGTGNGLFQGFPGAFLGLEQAGSPHESFNPVAREGFNPSGKKKKMRFVRELGKSKQPSLDFP